MGELRIGVISDTHGYVSPGVDRAFRGVARILHAGDVDSPAVLRRLAAIAPVTAVRGNVDTDGTTRALSRAEFVDIGGALVYVCHCAEYLEIDPVAAGVRVIVHGHTHRPELLTRDGVIWLNPGSASQPRGGHAPSVAVIAIDGQRLDASIIEVVP